MCLFCCVLCVALCCVLCVVLCELCVVFYFALYTKCVFFVCTFVCMRFAFVCCTAWCTCECVQACDCIPVEPEQVFKFSLSLLFSFPFRSYDLCHSKFHVPPPFLSGLRTYEWRSPEEVRGFPVVVEQFLRRMVGLLPGWLVL